MKSSMGFITTVLVAIFRINCWGKGESTDPTHAAMRVLNTFFTEKQNDGLVGRSSMRLGKLIKDDYAQDHIDMVNQVAGLVGYNEDIVAIYTQHAKYLASKQL